MQSITDPAMSREHALAAATCELERCLENATVFTVRQAMSTGFRRLRNSPPLTEAQIRIAIEYQLSLPQPEKLCFWLRQRHGLTSKQIADRVQIDVEWVRQSNARHLAELCSLLYP